MNHFVAPSVLACDFGRLKEEMEMLNQSQADFAHIDIMDGRFVPNISFGFPVLKSIQKHCTKPLDVHLMILEPELYLGRFRDAGAEIITVHVEACPHLHSTIQQIKATGARAGVALNPHTNIHQIEDIIAEVDLICLMSVNPGFGGQAFIANTLPKLRRLKQMCDQYAVHPLIEIDGGVGLGNASELLNAGANMLVAGSSVFKSEDPIDTIYKLKISGQESILV